jgi:hypothetical protein
MAGCSGDDFDSSGAGGSSATGGSAGSAAGSAGQGAQCGAAAAGGAAGADVGDCTSELYCKGCDQVSTTVGSCDQCARTQCCTQAAACMADASCARLMVCFFKSCLHQSASACIFDQCDGCIGGVGPFTALAACIDNNCKGDGTDAGTDPCPHLIP